MFVSQDVSDYIRTKSNWIDIISVAPFYFELILMFYSAQQSSLLKLMRLARMLRIFRIAKLMRHNQNLRVLIR